MGHWLTGEWIPCQLTHMELQSQSNPTDTEIAQDELKHYAYIVSVDTPRESKKKVFMGIVGGKVVVSKFLKVLQLCMP